MKIRFGQSGGLAGVNLRCEIDTKALPPAEAVEIEALVRACGMLKTKFTFLRVTACDIFGYSISVESNELTYLVGFNDLTVPEGAAFADLSQEACTGAALRRVIRN